MYRHGARFEDLGFAVREVDAKEGDKSSGDVAKARGGFPLSCTWRRRATFAISGSSSQTESEESNLPPSLL